MGKKLKLSIIIIFMISSFVAGQNTAEEKLSLMHNSLMLGLEEKGLNLGVEIISLSKYESVKEKTLFVLAEYFFAEGILGDIEEKTRIYKSNYQYINKAYTFYLELLRMYPNGNFKEIAKQRVNYLEQNYRDNLLFRSLANYLEIERIVVEKKINFLNLFIERNKENPFLFFSEGEKTSTYDLLNRYLDDIIVNNPTQAIFAYYYKLLTILSRNWKVDIITGKFEDRSLPNGRTVPFHPKDEIVNGVKTILNVLKDNYPHHPLTIRSYLVAVSYLIKANIWDYDSPEVKKWLQLALKNDKNQLGIKYLVTKEYLFRTEFEE